MPKKGVTNNPNGRPKMSNETIVVRTLNKMMLDAILTEIVSLDIDTLRDKYDTDQGKMPSLQTVVMCAYLNDHKRKNFDTAKWIVERLFGKVKEVFEHTTPDQMVDPKELIKLTEAAIEHIKKDQERENAARSTND